MENEVTELTPKEPTIDDMIKDVLEFAKRTNTAILIVTRSADDLPIIKGNGIRADLKELAEDVVAMLQPPSRRVKS